MAIVTASSIRARAHAQPVIENTDDAEVFNAEGVTPEAVDLQSINPLEGVASVTYLDGSTARVVDGVPVLEDRTEGEGEGDQSDETPEDEPQDDESDESDESDEDRRAREDLEKAEAEQAEAARLEKIRADAPSRGASTDTWEKFVASLDPKPEGYDESRDYSRDELATLVLGPKQ